MDVAYMVAQWERVRVGLLETIDKFRDAELDFKPFSTAWSLRQLMLHIAQEERGEFQYGIAQTLDTFPPEYDPQQYPTLAACRRERISLRHGRFAGQVISTFVRSVGVEPPLPIGSAQVSSPIDPNQASQTGLHTR